MPRAKRKQYPQHDVTYEVREAVLEANASLSAKLHRWLDTLHGLYELLRQQRENDRERARSARAAGGAHAFLTKGNQYNTIKALAKADTELGAVHSQVRQDVADRIEHGTKRWLKGEAGPLKSQPRSRYRSFTFTQYGFAVKIRSGRLHMSGLGEARLVGLRKLPGRVKSTRLVFKQGRWFAQFTCEVQRQHSEREERHASAATQALPDTGLDTGLARIATLADGTVFTPNKPLKTLLPLLRREQRHLSRQFEARKRAFVAAREQFKAQHLHGPLPEKSLAPLSNRLKRQIRRVAVLHAKVENTRRDQLRKVARRLEQRYRLVAVEEHGVEFMKRNRRTSRAVSDVAPGLFKNLLKHTLGERYVPVGTTRAGIGGNSQTCLCGERVPKALKERRHKCKACGLDADRDTVSANIVMGVAFGYANLGEVKLPVPGQGVVRRGEGKSRCKSSQPGASARATEPPVKRPSSGGRPLLRNTTGARGLPSKPRTRGSSSAGMRLPVLSG